MFFRAQDPAALGRWYQEHLGINTYGELPWQQQAGPTAFAPFPADTSDFGRPHIARMSNLRVRSLEAMAAQLRAADIAVEIDPERYPNGRFGRLHDPEGNPIELREPAGTDA